MENNALIIFVRNPESGTVKSRIAAQLGSERARAVYQELMQRTHAIVTDLPLIKYVFYWPEIPAHDLWSEKSFIRKVQRGDDLGARIANAVHDTLINQLSVVIIGSDCIDLDGNDIMQAFDALRYSDVVIGPAADGGYYLLGCRRYHPELFTDIPWGTGEVFKSTRSVLLRELLNFKILPVRHDVDRVEDIHLLEAKE